ncbi:MAG: hypothetical protein ACI8QW_001170, partial [Saprospiraceae bacterium]
NSADSSIKDSKGNSAMDHAMIQGNEGIIALLKKG